MATTNANTNINTNDQKQFTICITGERKKDSEFYDKIKSLITAHNPTLCIFGDCTGVDTLALKVCRELSISHQIFYANWRKYGTHAGPIRNTEMINNKPDLVLAFHSDYENSRGTKGTVKLAKKNNIPVEIYKSTI